MQEIHSDKLRIEEKKSVALSSVFAAIFITAIKAVVGILTGSLGILSEALHSGLDLIAAVVTYFSVRVSDKPADKEHNYGHGKIENLSALVQTVLLLATCIWIIIEAIERLVTGKTTIEVNIWSYVVIILSIIIDFSRSRALSRVAKKHNSQALAADALHFSSDIWSSSVVLIGLAFAQFNWFFVDSLAGLIVAGIVIAVSIRLGKRSIDVLLDKAPKQWIAEIKKTLETFDEVKQYHSLRIRSAGADTFIEFSVHMEPELKLRNVHEICDRIENELKNTIPRCHVWIHAEPDEKSHILSEAEDTYRH
ncbi:MAG: cation diffusion facilitator family transporter [Cyclobacteriaceae bacterium]|nr:cation diffusion facilitator family transporter [Cyclobacteriaceae bacterium]